MVLGQLFSASLYIFTFQGRSCTDEQRCWRRKTVAPFPGHDRGRRQLPDCEQSVTPPRSLRCRTRCLWPLHHHRSLPPSTFSACATAPSIASVRPAYGREGGGGRPVASSWVSRVPASHVQQPNISTAGRPRPLTLSLKVS